MFKTKQIVLLAAVILLAMFLRLYKLDSLPALNADEAAHGYNAYSLLITGKDEHGNSWPIHFQSFNDYKPGLYTYLTIPFVYFGGLSELPVRLPGALAGIGTIVVVYFLAEEITSKKSSLFALVSALFLAISPWHIHFSRGGWEVQVATFFITLGLLLFFRAIKNKRTLTFTTSIICFALSLYTYHSARLIVPLLGLGFVIFYWRDLIKLWKQILISLCIGIVVLIPLAHDLFGPAGLSRATGVGLFADTGPLSRINEQRGEHRNFSGLSAKLIHNKPVNYTLAFLENYSEHFWGEFLFLSGDDIQRNKVPEMGQMYIFDVVFLIFGLVFVIRKPTKKWGVVIWWLIVAPTAAAMTFQSPHALRAENMVIPLVLISAYGLTYLLKIFRNKFSNRIILSTGYFMVALMLVWGFARYQHLYWVQMNRAYPYSSQYGAKEVSEYIRNIYDDVDKIYITDRYDQPYILTLFYLKYPPAKFQVDHQLTPRDQFGFSTVREFDKFVFDTIDWQELRDNRNVLLVGTPEELGIDANANKEILFPNGSVAYKIVKL